eukprot:5224997-Alexandrium_andersonii.AAC.1
MQDPREDTSRRVEQRAMRTIVLGQFFGLPKGFQVPVAARRAAPGAIAAALEYAVLRAREERRGCTAA